MRNLVRLLGLVLSFTAGACAAGSGAFAWIEPQAGRRVIAVSGTLDFGDVPVGGQRDRSIAIVNFGTAPITVAGLHVPDDLLPHVTTTWPKGTIAAGAAQVVTVRFTPVTAGRFRGVVAVVGDQTGGAGTIAFSAHAVEGADAANPWFATRGRPTTLARWLLLQELATWFDMSVLALMNDVKDRT